MTCRRGFSYLFFLLFSLILLTFVVSFSGLLVRAGQIQKMDYAAVQARYYADSAVEFFKKSIVLPDNQIAKLKWLTLKDLPGFVYKLHWGGFKIVKNKDILYFIGFSGTDLSRATALRVWQKKEGLLSPWYE